MFDAVQFRDNVASLCTHPAEPPLDRLTASRYHPATEAWAAPASPTLLKTHTEVFKVGLCVG